MSEQSKRSDPVPKRSDPVPKRSNPASKGPDRVLRPFLEDPDLRLVLLSGLGIIVTFGAWVIAGAIRTRNLAVILALLVIGFASVEGVRSDWKSRRRAGPVTGLIATVWVLTGLATWAALHWNLF